MMKKYWLALSFILVSVTMAVTWMLLQALQGLWGEPASVWQLVAAPAGILLGGLAVIIVMCRPIGILTRHWIEDDTVCMENVLTRRVRKISLNAPCAYRRETWRTTWLILSEEPAGSVKAAIALHRQERAMFIPVAGPLAGHLAEKASRAKKLPQ